MSEIYDSIGGTYRVTRKQDPRIAAAIHEALGDARSVVNVGAGAGSYEPANKDVFAVEPSATMIAQRSKSSAPAIQARAEELPFRDSSFDAVLAVNTLHHWTDLRAGLRELRRIARRRIVIFLRDPNTGNRFWLTRDYFPALDGSPRIAAMVEAVRDQFKAIQDVPVSLPSDCADGLFSAYWSRPEMYLDEEIRRNISNFALATEEDLAGGLLSLEGDLRSGIWDKRYGHLRSLAELDLGHRVLVLEV